MTADRDALAQIIRNWRFDLDDTRNDAEPLADAIIAAGWRAPHPDYSVAWLTFRNPDGSMRYTTVAAGREGHWVANGEEMTGYAEVTPII